MESHQWRNCGHHNGAISDSTNSDWWKSGSHLLSACTAVTDSNIEYSSEPTVPASHPILSARSIDICAHTSHCPGNSLWKRKRCFSIRLLVADFLSHCAVTMAVLPNHHLFQSPQSFRTILPNGSYIWHKLSWSFLGLGVWWFPGHSIEMRSQKAKNQENRTRAIDHLRIDSFLVSFITSNFLRKVKWELY